MTAPFQARTALDLDWRAPLPVAARLARLDGALALLSDGQGPDGGRSIVAARPDAVLRAPTDAAGLFAPLRDPAWAEGVVGLAAYDAGARPATGARGPAEPASESGGWPDLMLARYPSMLVFDHAARAVRALGRGADARAARAAAEAAAAWLDGPDEAPATPPPPAQAFTAEAPDAAYRAAVAEIVARIGAGDLFQANVARAWGGALKAGADPFDAFLRLQPRRAAAFGAFWRLGDRAIVSNSPELFLAVDGERILTRPIKGTRPRHPDPARDAALRAELAASPKDRAENLMIVDLMRNDLARVARPGTVAVPDLFAVQALATVSHLVSTVTARRAPGAEVADILEAAFPPGSITGAPKHQAIKEIARHEPPRGPWCGSLFVRDGDALTASVLIRTAAFARGADGTWRFRALAGAGITADSDPDAELAETGAKIAALRDALIGALAGDGVSAGPDLG